MSVMTQEVREVDHEAMADSIELNYNSGRPLFIHGAPGIGKSDTVRDVAKRIADNEGRLFVEYEDIIDSDHPDSPEDGVVTADEVSDDGSSNVVAGVTYDEVEANPQDYFVFIDERLAQADPTDVKGLPDLEDRSTEFKPPKWINVITLDDMAGVVFCDELNLAPQLVQAAYYELILDRKVGNQRISDEVYMLGAGNREEDEAHIRSMPAPLRNRFGHLILNEPDNESWVDWAYSNGVDGRVVSFIQSNLGARNLFTPVSENPDAMAFPTPRTWEMVSDAIIAADEQGRLTNEEMRDIAATFVGNGVASTFKGFLDTAEEIDEQRFLNNPSEVQELGGNVSSQDIDKKHALVLSLSEEYNKAVDQSEERGDEVLEGILEICKYLEDEFVLLLLQTCKVRREEHFMNSAPEMEAFSEDLSKDLLRYMV